MYCNSEDDLANSDEERMEFAKHILERYRFLYRDAYSDKKEVRLVC